MPESVSVLVIEDDEDIRNTVADILRDNGYAVETAIHGADALLKLDTYTPRVILLDLMMPVMDGSAFLQELAERGGRAAIPVVLFTAHAKPVDSPWPVFATLRKPISMHELLSTVEAALQQK
jgi:CheY-like chemotaxis protein